MDRTLKKYADRFGVLDNHKVLQFEGGQVSPLPGARAVIGNVDRSAHRDGFLYPPMSCQRTFDPRSQQMLDEIEKTKRPALLWSLPPTHELTLDLTADLDVVRRQDASFILHLLGYLYGTRLQFEEWWVDGRIPVKSSHNIVVQSSTAADFVSRCYQTWLGWERTHQMKATNLLYMHGRAACYEWDWERFLIEYMVTDACWKIASALHHLKGVAHGCRISTLCTKFGIQVDAHRIKQIVDLRNALFHEALWAKGQPTMQVCADAFKLADDLRRLNQRIIPALLGYPTPYIRESWWHLGTCKFEPAPS